MSQPSPVLTSALSRSAVADAPATTPGLDDLALDTPRILHGILSPSASADELGWLSHYKVLRVLGRGGMGLVLEAEDTHLRRRVALKVMLPALADDPQARERFLREARAVAALRNEHIVVIYQVGQERDVPFLAMELLEGQSLEARLRSGPPLGVLEVVRIGRQIATGLAVAHRAGLIHRDIKPANIWLEAAKVKLLDFGLARPMTGDARLTGSGLIVGTPYYMSPEQARGHTVDGRADLFSLGSVLYMMCTGRPPFAGASVMAVLTALAVDTPRPIRELNPEVPPALAELISRLLEKDPQRRPATAADVVAALEAIESPLAALHATQVPLKTATLTAPDLPVAPPTARSSWPGRRWVVAAAAGAILILGGILLAIHLFSSNGHDGDRDQAKEPAAAKPAGPPLRIGILHSQTGTLSISERPVIQAMRLAIDDINHKGGVLDRPIEPVILDGQSDDFVFAHQAEKLITRERVVTLFGCWTSASRKAVKPVVERHNHLLMYPVSYEGMEQSPNIIYGGGVPNQSILPALKWFVGFQNKKRWFLVGSDYVFPRAANQVIRDLAAAHGCTIVGEEYALLGDTDLADVARKIASASPDLIINTLNGDSNIAFFRALRRENVRPPKVPTVSFSVSEEELSALPARDIAGDYVAGNYFQGIDRPQNQAFVAAFQARYGEGRGISDPMETAYYSVYLWAEAVRAAGQAEPQAIRAALLGRRYEAPQGLIQIDPATQHTVQHVRVLRFRLGTGGSLQLKEEYLSPEPVPPQPYPASRPPAGWNNYLFQLRREWKGQWANPGP